MSNPENQLIQGPVLPWSPSDSEVELIKKLSESNDPLDNAYSRAYCLGCFVTEFAGADGSSERGIAAVGSLDRVKIVEFRTASEDIDTQKLSMGDCINLGAYPATGKSRAERINTAIDGFLKTYIN